MHVGFWLTRHQNLTIMITDAVTFNIWLIITLILLLLIYNWKRLPVSRLLQSRFRQRRQTSRPIVVGIELNTTRRYSTHSLPTFASSSIATTTTYHSTTTLPLYEPPPSPPPNYLAPTPLVHRSIDRPPPVYLADQRRRSLPWRRSCQARLEVEI